MVKDNIHTTLWIRNVKRSWWYMEFHPYVPDSSSQKRLWRLLKDKPEHKFSHKTLTYNLSCLQHVLAQWLCWICGTGLSMSPLTWWSQRKWSPLPTAPQSPETRDLIAQGRTKQRWKKSVECLLMVFCYTHSQTSACSVVIREGLSGLHQEQIKTATAIHYAEWEKV